MRSVRPAIQPSNLKLKLYSYQQCGLAWYTLPHFVITIQPTSINK